MDRKLALLSVQPLFAPLAPGRLNALARRARLITLDEGETAALGPAGSELALIAEGHARYGVSGGTLGVIAFEDVAPGGVAGLSAALVHLAEDNAAALTSPHGALALILPAEPALAAITSNAQSALKLAQLLAEALAARPCTGQGKISGPYQRVYRDLLKRAAPAGGALWRVDPLPRHRELAAEAGVGEADAAAAVAHLLQLGLARRKYPGLEITDHAGLARLAG